MYAFLLLCLPCLTIYLMLTNRQYQFKSLIPPALTGLIASIAVCVIRGFFITYTHWWTDSFFATLIFIALRDTILPAIIMCALFFLFSKDTWTYKAASVTPLMGFFLSVYIPYLILSGSNMERHTAFMLFVKPVLIAAYLLALTVLVRHAVKSFTADNKRNGILYTAACIAVMFIPALTETLWYLHVIAILWISLAVLFTAGAIALYLLHTPKVTETERIPVFMTMDN